VAAAGGELGEVVPPGDVDAFAAAARRIADRGRDSFRVHMREAAAANSWRSVAGPLARLVEGVLDEPHRRVDVAAALKLGRHTALAAATRAARRAV
jgi:hypothetical protein